MPTLLDSTLNDQTRVVFVHRDVRLTRTLWHSVARQNHGHVSDRFRTFLVAYQTSRLLLHLLASCVIHEYQHTSFPGRLGCNMQCRAQVSSPVYSPNFSFTTFFRTAPMRCSAGPLDLCILILAIISSPKSLWPMQPIVYGWATHCFSTRLK